MVYCKILAWHVPEEVRNITIRAEHGICHIITRMINSRPQCHIHPGNGVKTLKYTRHIVIIFIIIIIIRVGWRTDLFQDCSSDSNYLETSG
jgi:hypothetical protein